MSAQRKRLLMLLLATSVLSLAGAATFSAWSAQTTNSPNKVTSGTVAISDNNPGTLFLTTDADQPLAPGKTLTRCIRVTYGGTVPAKVKLHTSDPASTNGDVYDLKVTAGTGGNQRDCGGAQPFVPFSSNSVVFDSTQPAPSTGKLSAFGTNHGSFASGIPLRPSATAPATDDWSSSTSPIAYRFEISLPSAADNADQNKPTDDFNFVWEARTP